MSSSTSSGKDRHSSPIPKSQTASRSRKPSGIISPPTRKGMMSIDKQAFDKDIKLPTIYVYEDAINPQTLQKFKKFMLKIQGVKPMSDAGFEKDVSAEHRDDEGGGSNGNDPSNGRKLKKIFINPELVKGCDFTHFVQHEIQPDPSIVSSVGYETVKFTYDNWTLNQIIESVLPDDDDKVSGFSQIGHIVHLNLRDHLLPFKSLIGQVFLEKISHAKTVVNKINIIDNKYRNFKMEVLAGDPNTVVTVRENRCEFEFDFATVYWNPRLSSEHDRLVKLIKQDEVMYDVFAGVGPFTIPAARSKINVLANDLNPDSFKWLQHNVTKNKVTNSVKCFNLDGRAFIQEAASVDLKERILAARNEGSGTKKRFHFVMNLPALAVDFLDGFWGILSSLNNNALLEDTVIAVHVYCFIKDVDGFKEKAIQLVKTQLGYDLPDENILQVTFVRNVAPNKEMLRVTFTLPIEVLVGSDKNKPLKRKFCEIDDDNLDQAEANDVQN
ncbi:unnamed protein product [Orchesella dallaii]|uniref:tRNA (guanine(37)-N1)-methyltransferase n=1 Tax=Orchesella dallaii TaxID=48710 RepID=A0ABP1QBD6_9HEXA